MLLGSSSVPTIYDGWQMANSMIATTIQMRKSRLIWFIVIMKQQKKKLKGVSPLNLDVCPMRRMEKLLKYSSVR